MSKRRRPMPKKVTVKPTIVEEPIVTVAPPKLKPDWKALVKQLPDAMSTPTQRWYGETFYPNSKIPEYLLIEFKDDFYLFPE